MRVLLVLRFRRSPALVAGSRVATPARSIDLLPTVLDALGLPPHTAATGRSLLRDAEAPVANLASLRLDGHDLRSATLGKCKLIHDRVRDVVQLVRLGTTLGTEAAVLPRSDPAATSAMLQLKAWLDADARSESEAGDASPEISEVSEEAHRTLEALGYLE